MPPLNLSSIFYWKVTLKFTMPPLQERGWGVGRFAKQHCSNYYNIGQSVSVLETLSINEKMLVKYPKLKFFLAVIWILQSGRLLGV